MPAASSSPIDPAIGQLLAAAQSLDQERARLLPALAAVPDPGRAGAAGPSSALLLRRAPAAQSPWTAGHCAGQARPMVLAGRRAWDATRVLATLGRSPPCPKRTSHDYAGPGCARARAVGTRRSHRDGRDMLQGLRS